MLDNFERVKAECLGDAGAFIDYLKSRGKWKKARRHGRGFLLCCPFHNDKTPSAFFELDNDHPFIHCYGEKGGRCLAPNGKKAIDFLSAIAMLECTDLKGAFKQMLDFCGKRIDRANADFLTLIKSGELKKQPPAKITIPRSTVETIKAPKCPQTHTNALQPPPLKKVGQTLNRTQTNDTAGVSPFLTASAEMSLAEIFERTRSVLKRANPQWTDAELNTRAVADAQMQFNALKHFRR